MSRPYFVASLRRSAGRSVSSGTWFGRACSPPMPARAPACTHTRGVQIAYAFLFRLLLVTAGRSEPSRLVVVAFLHCLFELLVVQDIPTDVRERHVVARPLPEAS